MCPGGDESCGSFDVHDYAVTSAATNALASLLHRHDIGQRQCSDETRK